MERWKKIALLLYWLVAPLIVVAGAQIVGGLPFTLTNGTVADATQVMADFNQIVNNVNANAAKNGVNSDITALTALSTPLNPSQGGSTAYIATATSTSAANTQVVATVVPATFSLVTNYAVTFVPGFTNTGAMTLAVAGTTAKNVFKQSFSGPIALVGGEVRASTVTTVVYDGTQYVLQELPPPLGISTSLASATTTDLGTVASHVVQVTGTTTITAFGSTAQTDFPVYFLRFSGALTLTHNGTSLILPGAANITTAANDTARALYLGSGNWQVTQYQIAARQFYPALGSTTQYLLSGTAATYTTPASVRAIKVQMIGGGGGGGATATNAGSTGGTTTFNSITAIGGVGGLAAGVVARQGGPGGTGGTGSASLRLPGSAGGNGSPNADGGANGAPGMFGSGAGIGAPAQNNSAGGNAAANSGAGGGGANSATTAAGGGGAGEYAEIVIAAPAATYTYTVGAAGAGGAAGTNVGGNGGTGVIIVTEFY